jgi:hypothetical protein
MIMMFMMMLMELPLKVDDVGAARCWAAARASA